MKAEEGHEQRGSVIFTIGHGTKSMDELIGLLKTYGVERIVDVRTVPKSRHNPQFNKDVLPERLGKAGIDYTHIKELGGLRRPDKDSLNTAWQNASFRGFADYMQTEAFAQNIERLIGLAEQTRTAIMCAESVPQRCHRSLIADALSVRGIKVRHIMSQTTCDDHQLTPSTRVQGLKVTYP
jgi:uncharacterized protein (DUF488 family)